VQLRHSIASAIAANQCQQHLGLPSVETTVLVSLERNHPSQPVALQQRQQHIFSGISAGNQPRLPNNRQQQRCQPHLTELEDVPSLQTLDSQFPDNGDESLMLLSPSSSPLPSSSSKKEIAEASATQVSATTVSAIAVTIVSCKKIKPLCNSYCRSEAQTSKYESKLLTP
jgi:hypothetical protein